MATTEQPYRELDLDPRRFRVLHPDKMTSRPMRCMDARRVAVLGVDLLQNETTGERFRWWPPAREG